MTLASIFYFLYEYYYKVSDWYSPYMVVLYIILYVIIAYSLGVTTQEDDRRIKKLLFSK